MTFTPFGENDAINASSLNARLAELDAIIALNSIQPGMIELFAGNAAPSGWLLCDGAAVSRTLYPALFTAIGTTFGAGDGTSTFNVPDLRGRVPIGAGTGAGLTARTLAQQVGAETHQLTVPELPAHTHSNLGLNIGTVASGAGSNAATSGGTTGTAGSNVAHNNVQPSLVVNYLIKV